MNLYVESNLLLISFVSLYILQTAVSVGLTVLNLKHLRAHGKQIPKGFEAFIDDEKLRTIHAYAVENIRLGGFQKVVIDAILLGVILLGFVNLVDELATSVRLPFLVHGAVFFVLMGAVFVVVRLPFDYYDTFVLEEKYGFNRSTLTLWLSDHAKAWLLEIALVFIVIVPLLWTIREFPNYWWIGGSAIVCVFELFLTVLYPVLIAPLFNKFEPLKDEALARKVEELINRADMRSGGIFQMDAGKRSSHSNAYFTGLSKTKRIVLFDTLIQSHSHDEILAILAHEIGHYKGKHILKSFIVSTLSLFVGFYLTYLMMNWELVYPTFALEASKPYLALFVIGVFWQKAGYFLQPFFLILSRRFERHADNYSVRLMRTAKPLTSALKRLASDNLANLAPHPWYVWANYSHPALLERVSVLEAEGSGREAKT